VLNLVSQGRFERPTFPLGGSYQAQSPLRQPSIYWP